MLSWMAVCVRNHNCLSRFFIETLNICFFLSLSTLDLYRTNLIWEYACKIHIISINLPYYLQLLGLSFKYSNILTKGSFGHILFKCVPTILQFQCWTEQCKWKLKILKLIRLWRTLYDWNNLLLYKLKCRNRGWKGVG